MRIWGSPTRDVYEGLQWEYEGLQRDVYEGPMKGGLQKYSNNDDYFPDSKKDLILFSKTNFFKINFFLISRATPVLQPVYKSWFLNLN